MTQEEKQLLLKDLCGRLPYGVKFQGEDSNVYTLDAANYFALQVENMVFKPYLRPMSSMTQSEIDEYFLELDKDEKLLFDGICDSVRLKGSDGSDTSATHVTHFGNDWLDAHYFDYRGLIGKGLALEAPEGMYVTTAQKKEEIEIPKNLEEALSILNEMVSDEDKEYLKENGAISAHLSLGMWIRNNFGLWENSEFYEYLFERGFTHPDDMSNYVIEEFIKTL